MRHRSPVRRVASVATALTASLAVLAAPAAAADLQPGSLPRGADLALPYVEGTTIVDGARVVVVPLTKPVLVAKVRGGYVVGDRRRAEVAFYDRDGVKRRLPGADDDTIVSADGRLYGTASLAGDGFTVVAVRRVEDGKQLAQRSFRSWVDTNIGSFAHPIDVDGSRMLIGGSGGRVVVWDWRRGTTRDVIDDKWHLQVGSLSRGIAAGWTAPGERCTFVARLATPRQRMWKSCDEQVVALSPDGRRMVTTDRRVFLGFGRVRFLVMRTVTGRELGRWTAERFTDIRWETDSAISFRVDGARKTAMVRCTPKRCRAASDPVPLPE
jgi:hypothetical protein